MAKRETKSEASRSAEADDEVSDSAADAYREARIFFELGEAESSKNAKSKRYGRLSWIAAADAVEFSKIPKRRRKDRREWIGQLSFFLGRVGVGLAVARGGHPRWKRLIDSGVVDFKGRASGDGERIRLTDKGRKFLARDRGDFGRAWSFCEPACEWYLCAMVMRLRAIYGTGSASKRRDVLAAVMAIEAQLISAKKTGRNLTEAKRTTILERLKMIPVAKTECETDAIHSLLAKDALVIRAAYVR